MIVQMNSWCIRIRVRSHACAMFAAKRCAHASVFYASKRVRVAVMPAPQSVTDACSSKVEVLVCMLACAHGHSLVCLCVRACTQALHWHCAHLVSTPASLHAWTCCTHMFHEHNALARARADL